MAALYIDRKFPDIWMDVVENVLKAKQMLAYSGKQEGDDPQKAALAMIQAVYSENPPLNFPLRKIAIGSVRDQMSRIEKDLAAWEKISVTTVF